MQCDRSSLAGAVGLQRATGINSFDGRGDKDGYRNLSGRVRGTWQPARMSSWAPRRSRSPAAAEFDGFDPVTFAHTDTLDSSRNRLAAGRIWARSATTPRRGEAQVGGSLLGSSNRNYPC